MKFSALSGLRFDQVLQGRIESLLRQLAETELSKSMPLEDAKKHANSIRAEITRTGRSLSITAPGLGNESWLKAVKNRARPRIARLVQDAARKSR